MAVGRIGRALQAFGLLVNLLSLIRTRYQRVRIALYPLPGMALVDGHYQDRRRALGRATPR